MDNFEKGLTANFLVSSIKITMIKINIKMLRKIVFISLALILSASMVSAQEAIGEQIQQQIGAQNIEQLQTMIQEKKQEIIQEIQAIQDEGQQEIYQNQNRIREAVHTLKSAEGLIGKIGPQISEIAENFNNSVQKTIQAEKKIQNRNIFTKFFFGGDKDSAREILQEININREKVQQLKQLRLECDCDDSVKEIVQEQVQNIEQEQNRLQQLVDEQESKKGIFGWLFGWLKF